MDEIHVQRLDVNTVADSGNMGFAWQLDTHYLIAWELFPDGEWHAVDYVRIESVPVYGARKCVIVKTYTGRWAKVHYQEAVRTWSEYMRGTDDLTMNAPNNPYRLNLFR